MQKSLELYQLTEKSYRHKTWKFHFFRENWHFWPKWASFLVKTASKHLILSKTDQRKRLQKSLGLYEVTEKSYGRITKNIQFFSKKIFDRNFFQWLRRALKPLSTASLTPKTPKYVVSTHSLVMHTKIFDFPKFWPKSEKKIFPLTKNFEKFFFRLSVSKPIFSENSDPVW